MECYEVGSYEDSELPSKEMIENGLIEKHILYLGPHSNTDKRGSTIQEDCFMAEGFLLSAGWLGWLRCGWCRRRRCTKAHFINGDAVIIRLCGAIITSSHEQR